jgi:hypothetical protein
VTIPEIGTCTPTGAHRGAHVEPHARPARRAQAPLPLHWISARRSPRPSRSSCAPGGDPRPGYRDRRRGGAAAQPRRQKPPGVAGPSTGPRREPARSRHLDETASPHARLGAETARTTGRARCDAALDRRPARALGRRPTTSPAADVPDATPRPGATSRCSSRRSATCCTRRGAGHPGARVSLSGAARGPASNASWPRSADDAAELARPVRDLRRRLLPGVPRRRRLRRVPRRQRAAAAPARGDPVRRPRAVGLRARGARASRGRRPRPATRGSPTSPTTTRRRSSRR